MLILLAAATIAAAPPPTVLPPTRPRTERTLNLYTRAIPSHCRDGRRNVVDRYGRPIAHRLGELPAAGPMLLVDRRIDGCPVITMMRGGPPPVADDPDPPPSAYRVMPMRPYKR
jgi:hypothetical protein